MTSDGFGSFGQLLRGHRSGSFRDPDRPKEKGRSGGTGTACGKEKREGAYFFLAAFLAGLAAAAALRFSSIAAWAAARRATGTRYGEQLT
jgi:hypothetical protein